jgi:predicted DNA-binding transcriptional regulator AlpA
MTNSNPYKDNRTIAAMQQAVVAALNRGEDASPHLEALANERARLKSEELEQIKTNRETGNPKLVYSVDEVSKLLQISRNLTYNLARQKILPGVIFLGSKRMVLSAKAIDKLIAGEGN